MFNCFVFNDLFEVLVIFFDGWEQLFIMNYFYYKEELEIVYFDVKFNNNK